MEWKIIWNVNVTTGRNIKGFYHSRTDGVKWHNDWEKEQIDFVEWVEELHTDIIYGRLEW